ncbi:hypothetical protein [Psychroserpens ponticola]|uniref:Lipoprotein n=1 Tax=Psychroserpens ponticola TaxID=2932268 RepID=A0ABY7S4H8_9FLAO|nr:hypothetical protein [Psychroserpens ponticola]WCO02805.1 hypothetical protein MUN68_004775 [Psychroserpens ponticola]
MNTKLILILAAVFTLSISCTEEDANEIVEQLEGLDDCHQNVLTEMLAIYEEYETQIAAVSDSDPNLACLERERIARDFLMEFLILESGINNTNTLENAGCLPYQIDSLLNEVGNYISLFDEEILRYEECEW